MKKILLLLLVSVLTITIQAQTPISSPSEKQGIKIYPNPVQSGGTITIISPADFIPQSVVLGTFSGKPLVPFYRNGVTVQSTLPLPTKLSSGIYFLAFRDKNGVTQTEKIMIK